MLGTSASSTLVSAKFEVGLIPILGGLVWFAAVVVGLGALAVAIWRARSASQATTATQA